MVLKGLSILIWAALASAKMDVMDGQVKYANPKSGQKISAGPDELENPEAFGGWKQYQKVEFPDKTAVTLDCKDKWLYPTHPTQILKQYHSYMHGSYNAHKLKGTDKPCLVKQRPPQNKCLKADRAEYALISDVYVDRCGNFYRGYAQTTFTGQEESMPSLFSVGRQRLPKQNAEFKAESYDAETYAVPLKALVFLTKLFPGDAKVIEKERKAAEKTHIFDPTTLLYKPTLETQGIHVQAPAPAAASE